MPELVSIIIPTHNYAHFLGDAIESALSQGYQPIEIIVVDDGSIDETPNVLGRYERAVQVVRLEGVGVARARNTGLTHSSGAYVVFLDADDLLLPGGIRAQAGYLDQHADVDAVYGAWYTCDARTGSSTLIRSSIRPTDLMPRLLMGNVVTTPSAMMLRRRALETLGGFTPAVSFTADWEMWLRLATRGHRFGEVSQPSAIYRVHGASMTRNLAQAEVDVWYVLDRYFNDGALLPEAHAIKWRAYFAMSVYLGKLHLEQGDQERAQVLVRRALDLNPEALDSIDFYYDISRAMWRHAQLKGADARIAADAMLRFSLALDGSPPVPPSRRAILYLAIGLAARRSRAQRVALCYLWMAARSSWRAVATRRQLAAAARICVPAQMTAAAESALARLRLRAADPPVPPLVSKVMVPRRSGGSAPAVRV